jgi:hypothetical protein
MDLVGAFRIGPMQVRYLLDADALTLTLSSCGDTACVHTCTQGTREVQNFHPQPVS